MIRIKFLLQPAAEKRSYSIHIIHCVQLLCAESAIVVSCSEGLDFVHQASYSSYVSQSYHTLYCCVAVRITRSCIIYYCCISYDVYLLMMVHRLCQRKAVGSLRTPPGYKTSDDGTTYCRTTQFGPRLDLTAPGF